jgi:hypothetical protein
MGSSVRVGLLRTHAKPAQSRVIVERRPKDFAVTVTEA